MSDEDLAQCFQTFVIGSASDLLCPCHSTQMRRRNKILCERHEDCWLSVCFQRLLIKLWRVLSIGHKSTSCRGLHFWRLNEWFLSSNNHHSMASPNNKDFKNWNLTALIVCVYQGILPRDFRVVRYVRTSLCQKHSQYILKVHSAHTQRVVSTNM